MKLNLSEIANKTDGELIGANLSISSVSINTRTLQAGDLYCGIKGANFDGNDFVEEAEKAGAIAVIVNGKRAVSIPQVVVNDTRLALAEMAGLWRQQLAQLKVVGITGSNGKTTVKEMVAAILSSDGTVLSTQGNLNNDIGVPLTLLRLNENHQYGVIEMGANHAGEIAYTSRYAQSDVTIITNVGPAHLEGFGSLDGIARAKGEIIGSLNAAGIAVLNYDDRFFNYWVQLAGSRKIISFGLTQGADVTAENIKMSIQGNEFSTRFELNWSERTLPMQLNLAGRHNVINALAASAAGFAVGLTPEQVKSGLARVKPVTGRMQPLIGTLGNVIIDDTYNANAASLKAGLDVLVELGSDPWVILGAFGELGPESSEIHEEIGFLLKTMGIKKLYATGKDARKTVSAFGNRGCFFEDQADLIKQLQNDLTGNETLLVKGSRSQRMEKVVAALVNEFRK